MLKKTLQLTFAFIAIFCSMGMLLAQSTTATLNGTVTDTAGAVIVDAQVTIANQSTGQEVQARTRGDGTYSVPGLASGTYQVTVSKPGFSSLTEKDIFLGPTVVRTVNTTLNVGQVNQQVTVEAVADQVQTSTGEVSERRQPAAGRDAAVEWKELSKPFGADAGRVEHLPGCGAGTRRFCHRQHHVDQWHGTERHAV